MPDDPLSLAVKALRQRERTSWELAEWLRKRGVGEGDVEETIATLEDFGELDDARFARRYAEDKRELRGWGAERIREALTARGVGRVEIDAALVDGYEQELERAIAQLGGRTEPLRTDAARGRALAFLIRRGYPYELAYEAIHSSERKAA